MLFIIIHLSEKDKHRWKQNCLFRRLKAIVDEWDPLGLLALGAPDDEYDCLTIHMVELYESQLDMLEMAERLEQCMEDHFGIGPSMMGLERSQVWREGIDSFCKRLEWERQSLAENQ
ncbi:hypothetical protein [Paenibacillus apiarius]|uniref:DUF1871 family protein n=1 Tax=Paenibacillus apiarius TaxID=46240 RepID=A0ABT4E1J0_9BACL|nr:hypothetical protein [Paenibacillus apiarius]MCY9512621.1 hypothetical protein [Paenibacillus apiarius]MCY9522378.1 hypothetical protein [Paenibacillus apiarius]MCY9553657.1 hypothetical protein [Paenibacillus apiarius]MCY9556601.1 hypothetical protein [Paenibacillus apiarius]MCY9682862.1 hypothetical protein [Paenibacillus apiarius]